MYRLLILVVVLQVVSSQYQGCSKGPACYKRGYEKDPYNNNCCNCCSGCNSNGGNGGNNNGGIGGNNGGNNGGNGNMGKGGNNNGGDGNMGKGGNNNGGDGNMGKGGNNNGGAGNGEDNNGGKDGNNGKDEKKSRFDKVVDEVSKNDKINQEFCEQSPNKGVREIYGPDFYKLVIPLRGFIDKDVDVKRKHRVVSINAVKNTDPKTFTDVRVLPEIVKADEAEWHLENGYIIFTVPYNVQFGKESFLKCNREVNVEEKLVPKSPGIEGNIDERYSADKH